MCVVHFDSIYEKKANLQPKLRSHLLWSWLYLLLLAPFSAFFASIIEKKRDSTANNFVVFLYVAALKNAF